MFEEKDLSRFEFDGKSYPYKCDLRVLDKVQHLEDDNSDLLIAEKHLLGNYPVKDQYGIYDMTSVQTSTPDIDLVITVAIWMIEEGIAITGEDIKPPTKDDFLNQDGRMLRIYADQVMTEWVRTWVDPETLKKTQASRNTKKSKATTKQE